MTTELSTTTWPTRELILLEASRLFAVRGYRGTSTHDIAAAVGVRQPSLYKHFASKQEIAEELLRRDLTAGIDALERMAADGGGAAVELYRYLQWEVRYVRSTPFDLRALYLDEILDLPEFEEGRAMNVRYSMLLRSIIERGIQSGEFLDLDGVRLSGDRCDRARNHSRYGRSLCGACRRRARPRRRLPTARAVACAIAPHARSWCGPNARPLSINRRGCATAADRRTARTAPWRAGGAPVCVPRTSRRPARQR